jgi:outer membrane protein OmpA-like peptidoglycan-associated protein
VKKIISVVGVGIALAAGGCAQVPSGKIQELENSISQTGGGNFGTFMTQGHNCADNLYHANMHLSEGKRVSGKFMNSGSKEIDDGIGHANEAAGQCSRAEQALSAYIDEKLAPLEARVKRLEGFHEVVASIKPEGIYFAFDKYDLNAESRAVLDSIYSSLESRGFPMVEIAGYTDDVGSEAYNLQLSDRRAQSVLDYLVSLGVPADRLSAKGFGENDPVAPNDSDAGRAQNRRVELHIFQ